MIDIHINGAPQNVTTGSTIADLIVLQKLTGRRIAVEVNLEIVPRSQYHQHIITAGDRIEIVHAIGGGQETT